VPFSSTLGVSVIVAEFTLGIHTHGITRCVLAAGAAQIAVVEASATSVVCLPGVNAEDVLSAYVTTARGFVDGDSVISIFNVSVVEDKTIPRIA